MGVCDPISGWKARSHPSGQRTGTTRRTRIGPKLYKQWASGGSRFDDVARSAFEGQRIIETHPHKLHAWL